MNTTTSSSELDSSRDAWWPQIDPETCTGCGDCVIACPTHALTLRKHVAVLARPSACNYCGVCEAICPVEAIDLPYQVTRDPTAPSLWA